MFGQKSGMAVAVAAVLTPAALTLKDECYNHIFFTFVTAHQSPLCSTNAISAMQGRGYLAAVYGQCIK